MKGVVLAGGNGSRLYPMTKVTNKHLLPIYDRPMIYYPLNTLVASGIQECMIVTGIEYVDHFSQLLGKEYGGMKLRYAVQDEAGGIAQALSLTENFVGKDDVMVILGDNIFQNDVDVGDFLLGARIYLKAVPDPERFGVATLKDGKVVSIIEKPKKTTSYYAVTGLYLYDNSVFDKIRELKPSKRGELEITDVNNMFLAKGNEPDGLDFRIVNGFWTDAGTVESLYKATSLVREIRQ
jgi:glucose-1-phosphate thymidylyltransferase